jgi:uncharacterized protein YndB with AHSA1/START domain
MDKGILAKASVTVDAPAAKVWEALTTPETIKKYWGGAETTTTWNVGDSITWRGEWQGKPFEDHGRILKFEPERTLVFTHFSPMGDKPNRPENHHTVTHKLSEADGKTTVRITQDGNSDEKEADAMSRNWQGMLNRLKEVVEAEEAKRASG